MFELNNKQRKYFGLELVEGSWDKVEFKGDTYRPDSILYFDGDTIKKMSYQLTQIIKKHNSMSRLRIVN